MDRQDAAQTKVLVAKAKKARKFMVNTCPASRHVHMIAETLAKGKTYHMLEEEPEHCAVSLLSVLTSLWEARDRLIELQGYWGDPRPIEEQVAEASAKIAAMPK